MLQSQILEDQKQQELNEELLKAICDKKDYSHIEEIINKGANINQPNEYGDTPLFYACFYGDAKTVITLIANGADINHVSNYGYTSLSYACLYGRAEIALILIEKGADVNLASNNGWNPLAYACLYGHMEDLEEIKYIQSNFELNQYYIRMHKCFNEAFLYSVLESQESSKIEEQSGVVNYLEVIANIICDIPFASLIINQIKHESSVISRINASGQEANFGDIFLTENPISSSLLSERIARRFTIVRELNEGETNQIIANSAITRQEAQLHEIKTCFAEGARKYLTKLDLNLERDFLGQELSLSNQLAIADFEKAIKFIFNENISAKIEDKIEEKERHQIIADNIVSKSIELEIKNYNPANKARNITQPANTGIESLTLAAIGKLEAKFEIIEKQQEEWRKSEEASKKKIEELTQQIKRLEKEIRQDTIRSAEQISKFFQQIKETKTSHQEPNPSIVEGVAIKNLRGDIGAKTGIKLTKSQSCIF